MKHFFGNIGRSIKAAFDVFNKVCYVFVCPAILLLGAISWVCDMIDLRNGKMW